MSDIDITCEIILDTQKFLAEIAESQQRIEKEMQKMGMLHVDIPIRAKDELTIPARQLVDKVNASGLQVTVPIVLSAAAGGSFDIQVNQLRSQLNQMAIDSSQTINNTTNTGGNEDGDSGGGGGRRRASTLTRLGQAFIMREAFHSLQDVRENEMQMTLAGNDPLAQQKAQLEMIGKISHLPIVGQAAQLAVDPDGRREAQIRANIRDVESQGKTDKMMYGADTATREAEADARIAGMAGYGRESFSAENDLRKKTQKIQDEGREDARLLQDRSENEKVQINASHGHGAVGGIINRFATGLGLRSYAADDDDEDQKNKEIQAQTRDASDRSAELEALNNRKQAAADREFRQKITDAEKREALADEQGMLRVSEINTGGAATHLRLQGQTREAGDLEFSEGLKREIQSLHDRANNEKDPNAARRFRAEAKARFEQMPGAIKEREQRENAQDRYSVAQSHARISDIGASADEGLKRASGDIRGSQLDALSRKIDDDVADRRRQAAVAPRKEDQDSLNNEAKAIADSKEKQLNALRITEARETANILIDITNTTNATLNRISGSYYKAEQDTLEAHFDKQIKAYQDAGRKEEAEAVKKEKTAAQAEQTAQHGREFSDLRESFESATERAKGHTANANALDYRQRLDNELFKHNGDPDFQHAIAERAQAEISSMINGAKYSPSSRRDGYMHLLAAAGDGPETAGTLRKLQSDLQHGYGAGIVGSDGKPMRTHHATAEEARRERIEKNLQKQMDADYTKSEHGYHFSNDEMSAHRKAQKKLDDMKSHDAVGANGLHQDGHGKLQNGMGEFSAAIGGFNDGTKKWSDVADKISNAPQLVVMDVT